ncbi:MAG: hypothetical protein PHP95_11205 [Desulfuromonadaceae bacterium]|nr:hypothetical protein [Desulfuromonadaceae bacterium]MDD2849014.1 hypothetical protein [Desulfuromonadaceae bacterium]MDD4131829.1 hypothetical protein [Desulfuromonadaceae bacterium]
MKLYHLTPAGEEILKNGFTDSDGFFMDKTFFAGVWFSDSPVDSSILSGGESQLLIEVPEEAVLEFELGEKGKPCREFLVPAEVLKEYGTPAII